jgi:hypothetical protein
VRRGRVEGVSGDAAGSGRPWAAERLGMTTWTMGMSSVENEEWGHWRRWLRAWFAIVVIWEICWRYQHVDTTERERELADGGRRTRQSGCRGGEYNGDYTVTWTCYLDLDYAQPPIEAYGVLYIFMCLQYSTSLFPSFFVSLQGIMIPCLRRRGRRLVVLLCRKPRLQYLRRSDCDPILLLILFSSFIDSFID